ncbi:MAG: cytochrome c [Bacteroidota bacterium]|nr:cytochrome c [Bacteroidota bacterium]MDP4197738.1 cytochrome c [Bacteroidota bacterium]
MKNIKTQNKMMSGILFCTLITMLTFPIGGKLIINNYFPQDNPQIGGTNWVAPESADKLKNPLKGNAKATKEGKSLYTTYCVSCHGNKGEGNGVASASLTPKPKNLTAKQVKDQTDGAIYWKITTGKPPMISWQSTLSDKQRWSLVNYIRALGK